MLFHTPTQFAVLVLVLIAGWLFGLASHPGGRKWRTRYEAERDAHAAYRKDADARIAELERRNAALERDLHAAHVAVPASARPEDAPRRGNWLGSGRDDDLSRIRGIDDGLEKRLADVGITSYGDVERLTDAEAADLERRLALPDGTIARDGWREQARLLAAGRDDDWKERYG